MQYGHIGFLYKFRNIRSDGIILNLIESFLHDKYETVVLNGQFTEWQSINNGESERSDLEPFFWLIHFDNFSELEVKVFTDVTFLFTVIDNNDASASYLINNLGKIQD